jgi:hypothetical protein
MRGKWGAKNFECDKDLQLARFGRYLPSEVGIKKFVKVYLAGKNINKGHFNEF